MSSHSARRTRTPRLDHGAVLEPRRAAPERLPRSRARRRAGSARARRARASAAARRGCRAVEERERRHQVRDERDLRRAVHAQDVEEQQLRERRPGERECKQRRDRLPAGRATAGRRAPGKEHDRAEERRRRREHRPRDRRRLRLPEETAGGVRERRRAATAHVPATAHHPLAGVDARQDADTDEPDRDPDEPLARRALARLELERQQRGEERQARLRDPGHARVDVLLAPGDERERHRRAQQTEHEPGAPHGCELARRRAARRRASRRRRRTAARSAITSRSDISVAGSKSRTPTLMNRYDAPQIAARSSTGGR